MKRVAGVVRSIRLTSDGRKLWQDGMGSNDMDRDNVPPERADIKSITQGTDEEREAGADN